MMCGAGICMLVWQWGCIIQPSIHAWRNLCRRLARIVYGDEDPLFAFFSQPHKFSLIIDSKMDWLIYKE
jgi:hypothetical protein